jgi:F-type H+-transporting ATPase subunit a
MIISVKTKGIFATFKHMFWPNPMQLVSEFSHALSLSLRLYGNIGGEFIVVLLVLQAAPYGIPLVIHTLCLIPVIIQPVIFTLLTASFLASAIHTVGKATKASQRV